MEAEKKIDETIPGGKYIVGDNYVNAEGEVLGPVKAEKTAGKREDYPETETKK